LLTIAPGSSEISDVKNCSDRLHQSTDKPSGNLRVETQPALGTAFSHQAKIAFGLAGSHVAIPPWKSFQALTY
jgi:hypothetical protein